jgi:pyruvate/2-oxoglutarate dehydrogenase complex dihydrolipoamide acyltransferase (E2) component
VAGLLRTIQRPLSTIGRIFSDTDTTHTNTGPADTPAKGNTPRPTQPSSSEFPGQNSHNEKVARASHEEQQQQRQQRHSAEDAAARQASAEAEQARRIQAQEHKVVVETLQGMFPQLDRDVIDDVVRLKEGRYVHSYSYAK